MLCCITLKRFYPYAKVVVISVCLVRDAITSTLNTAYMLVQQYLYQRQKHECSSFSMCATHTHKLNVAQRVQTQINHIQWLMAQSIYLWHVNLVPDKRNSATERDLERWKM